MRELVARRSTIEVPIGATVSVLAKPATRIPPRTPMDDGLPMIVSVVAVEARETPINTLLEMAFEEI